jgi:hypothetical protein
MDLHSPQSTTARTNISQSAVFKSPLVMASTAIVPLPICSRTVPVPQPQHSLAGCYTTITFSGRLRCCLYLYAAQESFLFTTELCPITLPAYNFLACTLQKTLLLCCVERLLPCNGLCWQSHYLITAAG